MKHKTFNIILSGIGGQGIITLSKIIAEAAILEGKDVKISELHGLSQRGGSVVVHLRLGKKIYSPLVSQGKANLILVLELQEVLKNCFFASKEVETVFLVSDQEIFSSAWAEDSLSPFKGKLPSKEKILNKINPFSKKVILLEAAKICREKIGKEVVIGIFMISYASFANLIPVKPESVLRAIKKIIPKKYLDLNKKAFKLAKKY